MPVTRNDHQFMWFEWGSKWSVYFIATPIFQRILHHIDQCSGFLFKKVSRQIFHASCLLLFGTISPLNFDRFINLHYFHAFSLFLTKYIKPFILNAGIYACCKSSKSEVRRVMMEKIMAFGLGLFVTYYSPSMEFNIQSTTKNWIIINISEC